MHGDGFGNGAELLLFAAGIFVGWQSHSRERAGMMAEVL